MIIIIKNLPLETTIEELTHFIKNTGFSISIEESVIFSGLDIDTSPLERIALLWLTPKKVAIRVINKLNNSLFKGQSINVREYITRSTDKQPKATHLYNAINLKDQSVLDRRRKPLIIPWKINGGQHDTRKL
jgi:hypothetical protein